MNRRDILKLAAAVPVTPIATLAKLALLVEVSPWIPQPCGCSDCPDQMACPYAFGYRTCDYCGSDALELLLEYEREFKFYRDVDGLILCERCVP